MVVPLFGWGALPGWGVMRNDPSAIGPPFLPLLDR